MVIEPKIRGFICTTSHPTGLTAAIQEQIDYVKAQGPLEGPLDIPKRVLIVGASVGYGMASRITSAFGCGASTIGVSFERPPTEKKPASAGWYSTIAFENAATEAGIYCKSLNADAFAHETRDKVIEIIKEDLGQIDLVIYSIGAPVRKLPDTGELVRSTLKPIGESYTATSVNTNNDTISQSTVEPATEEEIANTVTVMGGQDWELWIKALSEAGVLAEGAKTTAYSYIGTEITWPIYWNGTIGQAKKDLDRASKAINTSLETINGKAYVSILKSVITQSSSAIPVLPLYIAIVFKVMREKGLQEGTIEQVYRLFKTRLYGETITDASGRLRVDDWELRDDVQSVATDLWKTVNEDNLYDISDYGLYKEGFLKLFGFGIDGVDYSADVDTIIPNNIIDLT